MASKRLWMGIFGTGVLLGCSGLNRVGPDVTCEDLAQGARNACAEGIIASCLGNSVQFVSCAKEGACEEPWQEAGAFRCRRDGSPPVSNAALGAVNPDVSSSGGAGMADFDTPEPAVDTPDLCAPCATNGACSTGFCSGVARSDIATLVGVDTPDEGSCASAPVDLRACGCVIGFISGTSLCIGTGCSGDPVELCDHLSGEQFVSGAQPPEGECAVLPAQDPACANCLKGMCCAESMACESETACSALVECVTPCQTESCLDQCLNRHEAGIPTLLAWLECADDRCSLECN